MGDEIAVYRADAWDDPVLRPSDPTQRRAVALIAHTGNGGCAEQVAFIGDYIIIALADPETHAPQLAVRALSEFIEEQTEELRLDSAPGTLDEIERAAAA